jgi:hypothetical protein
MIINRLFDNLPSCIISSCCQNIDNITGSQKILILAADSGTFQNPAWADLEWEWAKWIERGMNEHVQYKAKLSKLHITSALKSELLFQHANYGFHQQKALSPSE